MQNASPPKWVEMEVLFADGVWYRGRLVERVAGSQPPRWKVQFDDGELRDDIWLANLEASVRFDDSSTASTVEVCVAGEWRRGRLVHLDMEGDVWAVAFEDGGCAEDVCLGDPDMRYVFAGRPGRGEHAGEGGFWKAQESRTAEPPIPPQRLPDSSVALTKLSERLDSQAKGVKFEWKIAKKTRKKRFTEKRKEKKTSNLWPIQRDALENGRAVRDGDQVLPFPRRWGCSHLRLLSLRTCSV